jgi:hypothetical protein
MIINIDNNENDKELENFFNFNNPVENYNQLNNLNCKQKEFELVIKNNFLTGGDFFNESKNFRFNSEIKIKKVPGLNTDWPEDHDNDKEKIPKILDYKIFLYSRNDKLYTLRNIRYLDSQRNLNSQMRKILVDWMMKVCFYHRLMRSTFCLSVVLLDSFLSQFENLEVKKLQLIGVCCLILSAKFKVNFIFIFFSF